MAVADIYNSPLVQKHKVTPQTTWHIKMGKTWKHVTA